MTSTSIEIHTKHQSRIKKFQLTEVEQVLRINLQNYAKHVIRNTTRQLAMRIRYCMF